MNKSLKNTWLGTTTIKRDQNDLNNEILNSAKTNRNNVFTQPQNINNQKLLKTNQTQPTLIELNSQSEKKLFIDFIQETGDYRNWGSINWRHKKQSGALTEILKFEHRADGSNAGIFVKAEANRFSFIEPTKIENVATPLANNHAANKVYVDTKVGPNFTEIVNWTGNINNTNLTFTKSTEFAQPGKFEFIITLKIDGKTFTKKTMLDIENYNDSNMSEVFYISSTNTAHPTQNLNLLNRAFVLAVNSSKQIQILKFGTIPTTNSTIKVFYRKIS